jgi:uncharacterized protein YuzE
VEAETIKVSDEINIDIAPDGSIYGIELLNANEQLKKEDNGKLLVINEATYSLILRIRLSQFKSFYHKAGTKITKFFSQCSLWLFFTLCSI